MGREFEAFDPAMAARPALIALNKLDLVAPDEAEKAAATMHARSGLEVFVISAGAACRPGPAQSMPSHTCSQP